MDLDALRRRLQRDLNSLRAPQGYLRAGAPRYATLFGRDSLIAAWQMLRYDPSIAASTLRVLASYQGRRVNARSEEQPGKILHEHRFDLASRAELPDWEFPYYGSVDSTPLFLIVASEYVQATGDERILDVLWPAVEAAHRWMSSLGDANGDGYIDYERKNPQGLFHQGWKDGSGDHLRIDPLVAMVEVQGYAVAAHRGFAALARRYGEDEGAAAARDAASRLQDALNRDFWMPEAGYYGLALDGAKHLRRAITSNPGHLLLMGVVPETRLATMVSRLFRRDLWTPFGVRTHASSEPDFDPFSYHMGTIWPHDNWFVWRGLRAVHRDADAKRVREAITSAYETLGKIPEFYTCIDDQLVDLSVGDPPTRANPLQAWSIGALWDMVSADDPGVSP